MLKPLLIATVAAGLLAACATPQSRPDLASRTAGPRQNCLTTGTRIALKEGQCVSAAGRVYTKDDLDQTGAITTAEALQRLDPALYR